MDSQGDRPDAVTGRDFDLGGRTFEFDDVAAVLACRAPFLYIDAGTPNVDVNRLRRMAPHLALGRTVGSGHFNQLEVPDQVNAMIARFLETVERCFATVTSTTQPTGASNVCGESGAMGMSPGEPSQEVSPAASRTRPCRTWTVASPGILVFGQLRSGD